jgi:hypothetical protein
MKTIVMEPTIQYLGKLAIESGNPKKMEELDSLLKSGEVKQLPNGSNYLVIISEEKVL